MSSGRPSEKNMYADIEAAWLALRSHYSVDPDNIVLYGQSIGTVPTVHLATRHQVAAVVLHSALMSGMRVAFPRARRTCCLDVFNRSVSLYSVSICCCFFLQCFETVRWVMGKVSHGAGVPLSCLFPCPFTSLFFALFYFFPFSFSHSLYLFSSFVHPFPFYQNSHHAVSRPRS